MDRIECTAFGHTPRHALRHGLVSGDAWTAKVDGRAEAMFGLVVVNAIGGEGRPWLLGTDEVYRHGREMVAFGPRVVGWMLDSSPRLSNLVSSGNSRAIRLLRRWGFDVGGDVQMIGGVPFLPFSMVR